METYTKHLQKIDEVDYEANSFPNSTKNGSSHLLTNPAWKKSLTLSDILHNDTELEHFKKFLSEQFAVEDLLFWIEIENFCHTDNKLVKDFKARQIRKKFFNQEYFLGPQSPATKEQQFELISRPKAYGQRLPKRPSSAVLMEAQKYARERLENKWVPMYMETPDFKQRLLSVNNGEIKKSTDFANSQEYIFLYRLLEDHVGRENFIQFLSIMGEPGQFLVNDLNFWLEDERFKEMYRNNVMMSMLEKKMQAIITCYLLSPVPPKLQLDIPQVIADKITKREQMGEHIFKEAQASVFRNLFSYCSSFQSFSDGHSNNSLPFKTLKEEAKKRRDSFFRRESAHLACKQQIASKRTKTQMKKQKNSLPDVKETSHAAIKFRLSELSSQYKTPYLYEQTNPDSNTIHSSKLCDAKSEVADVKISHKFGTTTCQSQMKMANAKPITVHNKMSKMVLPLITSTKHNSMKNVHRSSS